MALKKAVDAGSYPANLVIGATATASNTYNNDASYGPQALTDGDFRSRWATDDKEHEAWVAFEFASDIMFNEIVVTEGWDRVQAYRIEVMDTAGEWKPIFRGTKIGALGKPIRVSDTVARKVRLFIEKAKVGPTIWDFELFKR
jgi:hypothetical protein